jgi:hypothetical protein
LHERISAMNDMTKYFGLCETCDHDATCKLRRCSQLRIIQCEEFSALSGTSKAAPFQDAKMQLDSIELSRMGLCANCLNVLACGFPSARQNVLQCEEYILDQAGIIQPAQVEYSKSAA